MPTGATGPSMPAGRARRRRTLGIPPAGADAEPRRARVRRAAAVRDDLAVHLHRRGAGRDGDRGLPARAVGSFCARAAARRAARCRRESRRTRRHDAARAFRPTQRTAGCAGGERRAVRGLAVGYPEAPAGRSAAVRGKGARAGDAGVDRGCRRHRRYGGPHRIHESGRRAPDRMVAGRSPATPRRRGVRRRRRSHRRADPRPGCARARAKAA